MNNLELELEDNVKFQKYLDENIPDYIRNNEKMFDYFVNKSILTLSKERNPDISILKNLIKISKNINSKDPDTNAPLILSLNNELLEYALQNGANPNVKYNYSKIFNINSTYIVNDDAFKILVKYGADITNSEYKVIDNNIIKVYPFLTRLKDLDYDLYIQYILKYCSNNDKILKIINFEIINDDVNTLKLINITNLKDIEGVGRLISSFEMLEFLYQNGYDDNFENKDVIENVIQSQNQIHMDFLVELFNRGKIRFDTFLISEGFYFSYIFDKIYPSLNVDDISDYIFELSMTDNFEEKYMDNVLKFLTLKSSEQLTELLLIFFEKVKAAQPLFIERVLLAFPYINVNKYNEIGLSIKSYAQILNLTEILDIIEERELEEYMRIREQNKVNAKNIKVIENHYQRQIKEVYDPIALEYYTIKEFLNVDNNFIIVFSDKMYGFNSDHINDEIIICKWNDTYNDTLNYGEKYYNLNKIGINAGIIKKEDFDHTILKSLDSKIISLKSSDEKCSGIFLNYLKNIKETYYNIIEDYGFSIENQNSLTSYTRDWDVYIHKYLRYNGEDKDQYLLEDDEFNDNYDTFGKTPKLALEAIKNTIDKIKLAFLEAPTVNKPFIVYRGVKNEYYEDVNVSFISTTTDEKSAYKFSNGYLDMIFKDGKSYIIYRLKLNKGIPYISLSGLTYFTSENEILLPIGLKIKKVSETIKNKVNSQGYKYKVKYVDFEVYSQKEENLCRECVLYNVSEVF